MKPLGQDSVQETEVLNFFKALKGTRFIHGLSRGILHFDLLVTYNFGRKSMPDSQSVLLVELYSIKIFSPGSGTPGERKVSLLTMCTVMVI